MTAKVASVLSNTALALVSCLAALLLAELGLRLIHPKYEHLAEATLARDTGRFIPRLGYRRVRRHPDTGAWHSVLVNGLGLRQHRDFTAAQLARSVNIGFFGDSFIENFNMPAEFSFTEPLDYLLNVEREVPLGSGEGKPRPSFNVLNFGYGGWGTAQSMVRYETSDLRGQLHHVFYVYFRNDVLENVTWGLSKGEGYRPPWRFRLDASGQLERVEAGRGRAFASALLGRLHLSYLALDATSGFSEHVGWRWFDPPPSAFPVFRQLLRRFKQVVEADGARFHLVWLPLHIDSRVAAIVADEGVESVSLMDCFAERDPAHPQTPWLQSPYRFKNDWHWNEAGNRLAALCLHRFLEGELKLPRLSEEAAEGALRRYYAAFEGPPGHGPPEDLAAAAIRAKYTALLDGDASVVRPPRAPQAGRLVIRSTFDVYLHDGWLAYVKPGCGTANFDSMFFLHVAPADVGDLPPDRRAHGFDNLDFGGRPDASCAVWAKLPSYSIDRISTGQYDGEGDGVHEVLWQGEHVLAQTGLGRFPENP